MSYNGFTPTITDAFSTYLIHLNRTSSQHLVSAYTQSFNLFDSFIKTTFNINPNITPIPSFRVGWLSDYLVYLQSTKSVETEHLYSRAIIDFIEFTNSRNWTSFDLAHIKDMVSSLRRPKVHNISLPPVDIIQKIIRLALSSPPIADPDNIRETLRHLRDRAFILCLADTGLKVSEICSLRKNQFKPDSQSLSLSRSLSLPLSTQSAILLSSYLAERKPFDRKQKHLPSKDLPLFSRHDKRSGSKVLPISRWTASNIVIQFSDLALDTYDRQYLSETNQSISPETFRAYYVYNILSSSNDISEAQQKARHADPSTTQRYMKAFFDDDDSNSEVN
nr:site-specific integrase [Anaerolineae bacterium]